MNPFSFVPEVETLEGRDAPSSCCFSGCGVGPVPTPLPYSGPPQACAPPVCAPPVSGMQPSQLPTWGGSQMPAPVAGQDLSAGTVALAGLIQQQGQVTEHNASLLGVPGSGVTQGQVAGNLLTEQAFGRAQQVVAGSEFAADQQIAQTTNSAAQLFQVVQGQGETFQALEYGQGVVQQVTADVQPLV